MLTVQEKSSLQEIFDKISPSLPSPERTLDIRTKALELLSRTAYPNSSEETWRKLPIQNLDPFSYLKNRTHSEVSLKTIIADGLVLKSHMDFKNPDWDYVLNRLIEILNSNQDFFSLFHLAFFNHLFLIEVDSGKSISDYTRISMEFSSQENCIQPLVLIRQKSNSALPLILKYSVTETDEVVFFHSRENTFLESGASANFTLVENFSNSVFHIRKMEVNQDRDSFSRIRFFNMGGYRGKTWIHSHLSGKGSRTELSGAACLSKRELQDLEFIVSHDASHTESNLLFRTVLRDKSHHIFTGTLEIPKTSSHVSANQLNNNLMLQKTARAESMPKLEVFADDVKCSHGATMGEVSQDELFYLMTRGLTEQDARHLIVEGFLSEILDSIQDEDLQRELIDKFLNKLSV